MDVEHDAAHIDKSRQCENIASNIHLTLECFLLNKYQEEITAYIKIIKIVHTLSPFSPTCPGSPTTPGRPASPCAHNIH